METFEFAEIQAKKTPQGWVFTLHGQPFPKPPLENPGLLVCMTLDSVKKPMFRTILDLDEVPNLQSEDNEARKMVKDLAQGTEEFHQFEIWTPTSHGMVRILEMLHKEQEFIEK